MLRLFEEHIEKEFPFLKQARLLVAISGGIDSVVLARLCHAAGLDMALAHCNFRLRGEDSDGDEKFVRELAEELGADIYVAHFQTGDYARKQGTSIQVAARELRYNWFDHLLNEGKGEYLLTAHHADDSLETFLINLSRGTGIEGLSGIPSVNGKIVRPLLPFSREQVFGCLQENNWPWREDSSNADTKYLRNKVRHNVVPELKTLSFDFLQQFARTQKHLAECEAILMKHVEEIRKEIMRKEGERWIISVEELNKLHPHESYFYYLFKDFSFPVDEVRKLLHAMSGKQITSGKFIMLKDRGNLFIEPLKKEEDSCFVIDAGTEEVRNPIHLWFSETEITGNHDKNTVVIDKDKLNYPLKLRKWEKGDYFYPFGMTNRKKLSKFFKDEKVPVLDKQNTWLLCSGDAIVWVVGYRLDNRYKITPETVNTLYISANLKAGPETRI